MQHIFEQIELQAKLLNYFLGSNKSNINQCGAFSPSLAMDSERVQQNRKRYHVFQSEDFL